MVVGIYSADNSSLAPLQSRGLAAWARRASEAGTLTLGSQAVSWHAALPRGPERQHDRGDGADPLSQILPR